MRWVTRRWFVASPLTPHPSLNGFRLLDRLFDGADHVEGLLRQVVILAGDDGLEAGDGVLERHVLAGCASEGLGAKKGCDRKRWILRARATISLSSGDSSSMPRMAMMSRSSL